MLTRRGGGPRPSGALEVGERRRRAPQRAGMLGVLIAARTRSRWRSTTPGASPSADAAEQTPFTIIITSSAPISARTTPACLPATRDHRGSRSRLRSAARISALARNSSATASNSARSTCWRPTISAMKPNTASPVGAEQQLASGARRRRACARRRSPRSGPACWGSCETASRARRRRAARSRRRRRRGRARGRPRGGLQQALAVALRVRAHRSLGFRRWIAVARSDSRPASCDCPRIARSHGRHPTQAASGSGPSRPVSRWRARSSTTNNTAPTNEHAGGDAERDAGSPTRAPSLAATAGRAERSRLVVWSAASVARIASPSEPPTCWAVLNSPEASAGVVLADAGGGEQRDRHERQPHPDRHRHQADEQVRT